LYFVALGMDKREFVRSIAFTFLVVKAVQLATLVWYGLFGWSLVLMSLGLTAAGLAGFGLGLRLQDRLDQRAFNRAVLVFLAAPGRRSSDRRADFRPRRTGRPRAGTSPRRGTPRRSRLPR